MFVACYSLFSSFVVRVAWGPPFLVSCLPMKVDNSFSLFSPIDGQRVLCAFNFALATVTSRDRLFFYIIVAVADCVASGGGQDQYVASMVRAAQETHLAHLFVDVVQQAA